MSFWKIVLLALLTCSSLFVFISCGDNGTDPDDNGNDTTGDTTDTVAPFIFSWNPADGETEVSRAATLWVSICDTGGYASGLNPDSIWMNVNSVAVIPSLITNSCGGLDLRYIPPSQFDLGETIYVDVTAEDMAGHRANGSANFYIEIGDTFSLDIDSLPPLDGFASRSRPDGFTTKALYFSSPTSGSYVELSGSPYHLSFSPKRSWLLYDPYPDGDIYAENPSLGARLQFTSDIIEEKYPALSPDGHTLAFGRSEDIILYNFQTEEERVLASSSQGGRELEFSPDGQYLAYRSGSGSYNPKLFIRNVSDGDNITYTTIYNDVSSFDWSHTHNGIACVVTGNRLYYWNVEGGSYPQLLRSADNIQFTAFDGMDNIYFVEKYPSGDRILKSSISGPPSIVIDLTSESATVEALCASEYGDIIFSKRSGSSFTLEYLTSGNTSSTSITSSVGQTIQLQWY
ncbi:hypothetical protein KAH81_10125 [bacterium]|nr:hypothetical protein [bacterium]